MTRRRDSSVLPSALVLAFLGGVAAAGTFAQTRILGPALPVTVEFRALGEGGEPVLDLTAGQVTLKIDGKPRTLQSLELVQFGRPEDEAAQPGGLPAPFATNARPEERRELLLVLEDDSIAPGTERAVRAGVDRVLGAVAKRDVVGLLNIPKGGINIGFTTDREQIRAGVAELVGLSTRGQTDNDARCRTILTLQALKNLFLAVRGGAATSIVFFSSGVAPPDMTATVRLGQSSDLCIVKIDYYDELKQAAALSGVNFYAVQVFDDTAIATPASSNELLAGLESLAGTVNGDTIRLTNQGGTSLDRLARETGAYYRATFEPAPSERDDKSHRVDLSVSRRGVAIRSQPTIPIAKAATRPGSSRPASVTDLLRTSEVRRELPLRVAAYTSQGDGKNNVKIVAVFEAADVAEPLSSAAVALYDERGKLTSQVTLRKEELSRRTPFTAISAKPGTYRLRVAAVDQSGRRGTVDTQVQAEVTRLGQIAVSAMVLGTSDEGRFVPRLQFGEESALIAYLEISGVPKATELSAAIEIATTKDGPALGAVPARVQLGSGEGSWQISGAVGLGELPPGDYLLRAVIAVDGELLGRVVRTLRKVEPGS